MFFSDVGDMLRPIIVALVVTLDVALIVALDVALDIYVALIVALDVAVVVFSSRQERALNVLGKCCSSDVCKHLDKQTRQKDRQDRKTNSWMFML